MKGHEPIIAMRMQGYTPREVWIRVFDFEPKYYEWDEPSKSLENGFTARIEVYPMDKGALDFRCVTGLVVHLSGTDDERVLQTLKHIERAKPLRVITSTANIFIDSASRESRIAA